MPKLGIQKNIYIRILVRTRPRGTAFVRLRPTSASVRFERIYIRPTSDADRPLPVRLRPLWTEFIGPPSESVFQEGRPK